LATAAAAAARAACTALLPADRPASVASAGKAASTGHKGRLRRRQRPKQPRSAGRSSCLRTISHMRRISCGMWRCGPEDVDFDASTCRGSWDGCWTMLWRPCSVMPMAPGSRPAGGRCSLRSVGRAPQPCSTGASGCVQTCRACRYVPAESEQTRACLVSVVKGTAPLRPETWRPASFASDPGLACRSCGGRGYRIDARCST
jgi:hypothetical protein